MSTTQYIGARYVPLFADPIKWNSTRAYEPLTIVIHEGNSYTSRQYVPIGIGIDNDDYWALTGNYNAQVEQYRNEVTNINNIINGTVIPAVNQNSSNITKNASAISDEITRAETAEKVNADNLTAEIANRKSSDNTLQNNISINESNITAISDKIEWVTLEEFGGVGDGETDCSDALIKALASNKPILIKNGTYIITSDIEIGANVVIRGVSPTISILKFNNGSITASSNAHSQCENVFINDVGFSSPQTNEKPLFTLTTAMYWYIDRCVFNVYGTVFKCGSWYDSRISNCNFYNCGSENTGAFELNDVTKASGAKDGSNNLYLYGNRFEYFRGLLFNITSNYNNTFFFVNNKFESGNVNERRLARVIDSHAGHCYFVNSTIAITNDCKYPIFTFTTASDLNVVNTYMYWFAGSETPTYQMATFNGNCNGTFWVYQKRQDTSTTLNLRDTFKLSTEITNKGDDSFRLYSNYMSLLSPIGSPFVTINKDADTGYYIPNKNGTLYISAKFTEAVKCIVRDVTRYDYPLINKTDAVPFTLEVPCYAGQKFIVNVADDSKATINVSLKTYGYNYIK